MKLSLTIIAVAFALTNAPAFAHEWDSPSDTPAVQFNEPAFALQPVSNVAPDATGVQWDLKSLRCEERFEEQRDRHCEDNDIECQHHHGNTTLATGALDNLPRTTFRTGKETPAGLPECRTCTLGPGGAFGLPTTSLATMSDK